MKVLYFHQHFSTPAGATGTRSYEFARRLIAKGHQVTMVCGSYAAGFTGLTGPFIRGKRRGNVNGIDVIEYELPYSNADSFGRRVYTFLRFVRSSTWTALTANYDIVFASSTPLTVAIPGIVAKWIRGKRFVFEVRDLWPELPREMGVIRNPLILLAMELLETLAYRAADGCIALAPGIEAGIRRKNPKQRIIMIPNGSDLRMDCAAPGLAFERFAPVLKALEGKLKCVFAGAHGIANGLDAVLDAAAVLAKRGRDDIVFLFIGSGMQKAALATRAREEGLTNCLFFDPIPKAELFALQRQLDIGLMILKNVPAFYNGTSPNKFFDYISSGLPVLINYPGWLAQLVEQEECGIVVPPEDPVAFAGALEELATTPEKRLAMGMRARALAERQFARDVLGSAFVDFIEASMHLGSGTAWSERTNVKE